MRRAIIISITILSLIGWAYGQSTKDKLVDDAYYWPTDTVISTTPVYDRNIREFIFLEDTTRSDTVRMRIIRK